MEPQLYVPLTKTQLETAYKFSAGLDNVILSYGDIKSPGYCVRFWHYMLVLQMVERIEETSSLASIDLN